MKKYFLTGLVTLLPLAVTFWVIAFVVNFLTKPFMGAVTSFFTSYTQFSTYVPEQAVRTISQILILIGLVLFTLFLGFVARRLFFSQLLRFGDHLLHKIPLVNKVYKTSKDIIQSLFNSQNGSFQQVVLLPFPYKGAYCLALISNNSPSTCSETLEMDMVSVFIPTAPNPTTGFLVMSRKSELIYLDMKSEAAIKYIVSCAVIQPESASEQL